MENGYDIIAKSFVERDVRHLFGLAGYANLGVIVRTVESGAQFFSSRHEAGAVAMAAGYARATSEVGVATVTRGPAVTNTITALVSAARDRAPIVLHAGDSARDDLWNPQRIDQRAMIESAGIDVVACQDPATLEASLSNAFDLAVERRSPVVLNIPADLVHDAAVPQQATAPRPRADTTNETTAAPDPVLIEEVADLLMKAKRPLIVAGLGAVAAEAAPALVALAEATGSLLATTLPASGLFSNADFAIGFVGGFAVPSRRNLVQQADVVLAVGASLNPHTTFEGRLFRAATVIHCDADAAAIGRMQAADVGLVADGATAAHALVGAVRRRSRSDPGLRTSEVADVLARSHRGADIAQGGGASGVDPRRFLRALDDLLPRQRRIIFDIGHFATFTCQSLTIDYPGQLLPCQGFAAVGQALPTAVGAAIGCPEDTVVAVMGDGGLLMSLAELETAARTARNLLIVVLNDRAYGAEVHHAYRNNLDPSVAQLPVHSLAELATALGVQGTTVASVDDFDKLPELARAPGPRLVDVCIDPAVIGSERYRPQPVAVG